MKPDTEHITDPLHEQLNTHTTPTSGLVDRLFQQRKQAQLKALSVLEQELTVSERDGRRAATRMRSRNPVNKGNNNG